MVFHMPLLWDVRASCWSLVLVECGVMGLSHQMKIMAHIQKRVSAFLFDLDYVGVG